MKDLEFNYRLIHWTCHCGSSPSNDRVTIGVSSMAELVATWKCLRCSEEVMARIPLEQLIADLPAPPSSSSGSEDHGFTEADKGWLDKVHIRLDD